MFDILVCNYLQLFTACILITLKITEGCIYVQILTGTIEIPVLLPVACASGGDPAHSCNLYYSKSIYNAILFQPGVCHLCFVIRMKNNPVS